MRTRTQSNIHVPFRGASTLVGDYFTWATYAQGFLEWKMSTRPVRTDYSVSPEPMPSGMFLGRESTITDELPFRKRVGFVDHVVREISPVASSWIGGAYWICTNYDAASLPWGPYRFAPRWISRYDGYGPLIEAARAASDHDPAFNVCSAGLDTLPKGKAPDPHRLVDQIMRRLVKFNGATYLAELKDLPATVKYLHRYSKAAVTLTDKRLMLQAKAIVDKAVRSFSKGEFRRFDQLSVNMRAEFLLHLAGKFGSDAYLGAIFGLIPSVGETLELRRQIETQKQRRLSFTVTVRTNESYPAVWTSGGYGLCSSIALTSTSHVDRVIGAKVRVIANPIASAEMTRINTALDQYLGYNPARPLWAIVPLSFVVDWFFGVDSIIDAAYLATTRKVDCQFWQSTKSERSWAASATFQTDVTGQEGSTDYSWFVTPPHGWPVYKTQQFTGRFSRYKREPTSIPTGSFVPKKPELPSMGKLISLALIGIGLVA